MTIDSRSFFPTRQSRRWQFVHPYSVAFLVLLTLWWLVLAFFHAYAWIDLAIADYFFIPFHCAGDPDAIRVCGHFPMTLEFLLKQVRKVLYYMPSALAAVALIILIVRLSRPRPSYDIVYTEKLGAAVASFVIGPYVLVNLLLKTISGRARPYETDIFGGDLGFTAAGSFAGNCVNNCSFISGESAAAGWAACMVMLLPRRLRIYLAPPLMAASLFTPALRVSFGGHYLSDAILGWLSSPVIFFAVLAVVETTRRRKIIRRMT